MMKKKYSEADGRITLITIMLFYYKSKEDVQVAKPIMVFQSFFCCIETSYRNKDTAFSCVMQLFIQIAKQINTNDLENNYQNHHIHIKKMLLMLFSVSVMVLFIRDKVSFTPAFLGPCTFCEDVLFLKLLFIWSFGYVSMVSFQLKKKQCLHGDCVLCKIAF